ncbi:dicarboxylate/amino acid:cation symporter [Flavobacteriaceae bacterium]|jgi:Na+/H+-dicarboxylate symporter|uniref:dicarboxylate/amino acid:cation symporter n=1 Tax=Candidatus Arcticimaribacter forsetii TaxID=2820661 RepID=UPI0020776785|nr:dicarboxylate/amino acid:cation symporter [Candidatus Arcticimaribacter forsetii]MCH1538944.1 dicarboxylate/amino acid:cation symporter [Flavobacteriaceae bacterium]MDB2325623.1 dicarboxylate/amino acid:cation symporter [Flavobacteriaceae bacterium]MDB2330072.1 dicarboxylate/amino acid:cation symporter [Flavobacteriaceae bacterium]MDB2345761.1 dicarboxylate/amino acid:cation symporter [Flavobacteriaceae bacterium]MDB4620599.1 dicarboxylate/amino acid:cation symporter [Flavobacteriaceae bact
MKKLALHWKILIGMALGVIFGLLMSFINGGAEFVGEFVKPFGTIFINLLKLIAIPLILASLIKGVSDLKDISKLSQMGGRTILTYLSTTLVAVVIGLILVNSIQPGKSISIETRKELVEAYASDADQKREVAAKQSSAGRLQPLVDIVPSNLFSAASNNRNMLQIIFFAIFFGIGIILIPEKESSLVKGFFDSFNAVILKLIDLIMMAAPYGVFALLAALVVEAPSLELFKALALYAITLLAGLALMIGFYALMVRILIKKSPSFFFKGIAPAQLLAFSTSSSAATLPVTMECVEGNLGVDKEVTSFVLPIGATINMDGTSVYQGVAAVFIAQAFGLDLSLSAQLGIIFTATLASIGTAAVPSAGIVMLVIVLAQAGIPEAGLALIFAIDRPLDMCRTVVNVTGDAAVSMFVAKSINKLK